MSPRTAVPLLVALAYVACAPAAPPATPTPAALAHTESLYADLRALRDRIDVTTAAGRRATAEGTPVETLTRRYGVLRGGVVARLNALPGSGWSAEDARAIAVMRAALGGELGKIAPLEISASADAARAPDCEYDAPAIAALENGLDSLVARAYACFGWAQHHVTVGAKQTDRLSVLGALARPRIATSDAGSFSRSPRCGAA